MIPPYQAHGQFSIAFEPLNSAGSISDYSLQGQYSGSFALPGMVFPTGNISMILFRQVHRQFLLPLSL